MRSFHVLYDFEQGAPADAFEDYELELAYQAPDRGYVRFEGDSRLFESWCTEQRLVVHTLDDEEGERWHSLDLPEPRERPEGAGVVLCLVWPGLDDGDDFGAWLEYRAQRLAPLDWLNLLPTGPSALLDGERIYWSGQGFRCWLDAATGLPECLDYRTRDGFEFRLDIDEHTVGEPLDPRLLEPPPESAAAEPFGS